MASPPTAQDPRRQHRYSQPAPGSEDLLCTGTAGRRSRASRRQQRPADRRMPAPDDAVSPAPSGRHEGVRRCGDGLYAGTDPHRDGERQGAVGLTAASGQNAQRLHPTSSAAPMRRLILVTVRKVVRRLLRGNPHGACRGRDGRAAGTRNRGCHGSILGLWLDPLGHLQKGMNV